MRKGENNLEKVKNRLLKWVKSTAGVISLCLFGVSCLLLFLSLCFMPEESEIMQNICIGLATNLIGIIVTVSFVQFFLDRQSVKIEKLEEYKKIIRYSKYGKILINEYIIYHNMVATPMEGRNNIPRDRFIEEYNLEDMRDLYKSTLLLKDRFYTPVIERYYDVEQELSAYFLRMLEEIDFKYAAELEVILTTFLVRSREMDVRRSVIGEQQLAAGGKKNSDFIAEELKNPKRDYLKDFAAGKLRGNIMMPVVQLFYFMKFQRTCLIEIIDEISIIEKDIEKIEGC